MNCIQCQKLIKDDDRCCQVYGNDWVHLECMEDFLRERNKVNDELGIEYRYDNILDLLSLNQKEIDNAT